MRGVNSPHAYFRTPAYHAMNDIKNYGFNTVRIVWCADNLERGGRCERKDMHGLEHLEAIFAKLRDLKLVAVLNLQNATGSDDPWHLALMVDWYTRPEVKDLLFRYQDMLIINIANEWYGSWHDPYQVYRNTYQREIRRLRDAGLPHVLMIDARGWGQQFASIPENFEQLQGIDENLLFSAHFYDAFHNADRVREVFQTVRQMKIPFVVGEFACQHYPGQYVDCETIMAEANRNGETYGYLAWSWAGNSSDLAGLDITSNRDWRSLTDWGQQLVYGAHGIKASSRQACFFDLQDC